MPHAPKPFFKAKRNTWYAEIRRTQHALGKHPEGLPPPAKKGGVLQAPPEILQAFYRLMADPEQAEGPGPRVREVPGQQQQLVLEVLDEFLEWCQKHKARATYAWYRDRIQAFVATIPGHLPVAELKPIHVERWVDAHPGWSASHQRGSKVAVQRAFSWAEKMGLVAVSPLRHLDKPEAGKREQVVSLVEYEALLKRYPDSFGELLQMAWHTGARPQESIRVEARHVDLAARRITLPPAEAKGKKRYRVIYLDDHALALVTRLAAEHPAGPLFRNADGEPWTAWAVNCRFGRLQLARGREELQKEGFTPDPAEVARLAATLPRTRRESGRTVQKSAKELAREARKKLVSAAARQRGDKFCLYAFRHNAASRIMPTRFAG
jgi:integrase